MMQQLGQERMGFLDTLAHAIPAYVNADRQGIDKQARHTLGPGAALHAANPELAAKTVQPPDPVIPPFQWPNGLSNNPAVSDHGGMEPAALANSYPKKRGKYQTGAQQPSKEKIFLSRKTQLTMGMNGGIFKTPAITVRESEFSIVALIPVGDGSSAFIPGPGSELELGFDGKTVKAFYPGAYVEIPELGCGIMTFIKG